MYRQHVLDVHTAAKCSNCGDMFENKLDLAEHKAIYLEPTTQYLIFLKCCKACDECGRKYKTWKSFLDHKEFNHVSKCAGLKYSCPIAMTSYCDAIWSVRWKNSVA